MTLDEWFNPFAIILKAIQTLKELLGDPISIYYFGYGITAGLGVFSTPFYFAYGLIEIVM